MNDRYKEKFGVERRLMRGNYTITNTTMEIGKPDIQVVQQHSFELFAHGSLKPRHLTSGIAVAGICLTGYFLEKKFGLVSRVLGRGSAIYEVSFPTASSAAFEEFVNNGTLGTELKQMFENLEDSLKELGDDELITELLDNKEFAKVKEIRLKSIELTDAESVEKLLRDSEHDLKLPAIQPPKSLRVKQNLQSPSTSIIVYYQPPDEEVDKYVITIKNLMNAKDSTMHETTDEYVVVAGLQPRQSYFVWVQSQRDGLLSKKVMLPQPIETDQFDPRPWRAADGAASELGYGAESVRTDDMYGAGIHDDDAETASAPTDTEHNLWKTDLPKELRKIYPPSFIDSKLKRLLFKFDELGVAEAKDLKYFNTKEVAELLKEALKPIEILKLMDYASDSGTSDVKQNPSPMSFSIEKFCGGSLIANSAISGESSVQTRSDRSYIDS